MRRRHETHRPRRAGLTLIELLVVILIIGTLMALLLPAVGGAMRAAKQGQVTAEINNMATALADFKNKFGEFPPSRLYCAEDGDYGIATADSADLKQLKQRSLRFIRKFWPRVQLGTTSGTPPTIGGQGYYDFNGNNVNDSGTTGTGAYILQGPECLVFFLGGIPKPLTVGNRTTYAMVGFAKNPTNPFLTATGTTTENRLPPLYDFNASRLDVCEPDPLLSTATVPKFNGFPCYLDPLGSSANGQRITEGSDKRPYAYFYSYGASSYDPNDYNADYEVDDSSGSKIARSFYVTYQSDLVSSVGPNPYTVSGPVGVNGASNTSATFQNADSFQLFSSGIDRKWGIGGQFTSSSSPRTPFDAGTAGPFYDKGTYITPTPTGDPRAGERDNLSNFSGGRMD